MDWFADDDFWRDNYELMFSADAFERARRDLDRLLALVGTTPSRAPTHVLDLACGPGRFSIPLAERGMQVTGVDLSPLLLERAAANAAAAGVGVEVTPEFVRSDMRDFVRPAAYDLALSLYTSFGYFDDRDDDRRVLANLFSSLRPGGALVVDVVGKELHGRRGDRISDLADGATCVQRIKVTDDWSRLQSEWIVVRGETARRYHFSHRLYSGVELRDEMERLGFTVSLFGDFGGAPYDSQAQRLVAVGRKPRPAS